MMPGFDGTGPNGLGPMTGGGRGFCTLPAGRAPVAYPQMGVASLFGALNPFRWTVAPGAYTPFRATMAPWAYGTFGGRGMRGGRGRGCGWGRGGW